MREAIRRVMTVMFLSGLIMFARSGGVNATNSSKLRVGIYMNNSDGGATYGYKGVMGTLKNLKGMECEYVIDLDLKDLTKYDVLIIPDIKQMGNEPFDWVESGINALENHGLDRCLDHGLDGFKRYVALAVLGRNFQKVGAILQARELKKQKRKKFADSGGLKKAA